eukprot:m.461762 g.461762  ORF g.461762 m.461762 type:complete len:66 (-) comp22402_c0_seq1:351-548(-)
MAYSDAAFARAWSIPANNVSFMYAENTLCNGGNCESQSLTTWGRPLSNRQPQTLPALTVRRLCCT